MNLSNTKPPCYDEANAFFELEKLKLGTIFTYGDTLYNPDNLEIAQDLIVHESVHAEQQGHDDTVAKLWWQRYLADPDFRLDQEAEAYAAQYDYLCTLHKDKNARYRILLRLTKMLAGPMYKLEMSTADVMTKIREKSKIKG